MFESQSFLFFCRSDGFVSPAGDQKTIQLRGERARSRVLSPREEPTMKTWRQQMKAGEAREDGKTGRWKWNGYEKQIGSVRFEDD